MRCKVVRFEAVWSEIPWEIRNKQIYVNETSGINRIVQETIFQCS